MIKLKLVGGEELYVNEAYVEVIEASSDNDTTVKIHDGTTFVVEQKPDEIVELIRSWAKGARGR